MAPPYSCHQLSLAARMALAAAAQLAPGDARAWTERAALAADAGNPRAAAADARRALTWAARIVR